MLLRSLHIASRQLFYLLVVLIILSLLGLMAAVWLSDEVAKRKDEIAAWASQQTGYPVTIGEAGLYWFDLIPKLEVHQIVLMQKTGDIPIVTAGQMYLSLDILQTLNQGEPVVADASIKQAKLAVDRSLEGQLQLVGLEKGSRRRTDVTVPEVIRWFTWLKQLQLSDIQLAYTDRQRPAMSGAYQLKQLELEFAGKQWQAGAEVIFPENIGTSFMLMAQAEISEGYQLSSWQATMETQQLSLAPLLADSSLSGIKFESGLASGVVRAAQNTAGETTADLDLILTDMTLASEKTGEVFDQVVVDQLQGRFSFQQRADSWQLNGDALQMQMAGEPWPPFTNFTVQQDEAGLVTAAADYLRLSDLTAVALLMKDMPELLTATKPAGDVHDLSVSYQLQSGLQRIKFQADDIALLPWKDYPGANDLSFDLDWQHNQGSVSLHSHKTTIYADNWLKDAVYFESLTGDLSWREQPGNWHVVAEKLHVWNEDLNLSFNGRINHQNASTDTDLRLDLQDVKVNRWRAYVPEKILPEDFEEWSRDAFHDGVIRSGYIEMQGDPAAFPFDEEPQRGKFDMQLEVENTRLHYAEGWPDLMQVSGTISGQGNNLLIKSQSGNIGGFSFKDITTTISNLVRPKPVLRVDGSLTGMTPSALAFLQNSPLNKRFGSVTEWVQAQGKSEIQLKLMVPLVNPDDTEVSGHVTFADSQLKTKVIPELELTGINGQLAFSNDGVNAQAIKAIAMNEPVLIDVAPDTDQTRVVISGKATISALRSLWPKLIPSFVDGEGDYQTQVLIKEPEQGQFDVLVKLLSDLRGITIDAPAPLGKTASQRKSLQIAIEDNGQQLYQVSFGNWLNAALFTENKALAGEVILGGEIARASGPGLRIGGRLDSLNLDEWLDWQAQQTQTSAQSPVAGIDRLDIRLDQVQLAQQHLEDLQVQATQAREQWQIKLDSAQVKGDVSMPQQISNDSPLNVRLDYLRLNLPEKDSPVAEPASERDLWPALRLDIGEFELNGMRLGQFNLRANRSADTWLVESASLKSPVLQASLTGNWTQTSAGERSQFDIVASSDDLKALLAYYGYQEEIKARRVQINSQLNWRGDPTDFALAIMQGKMDLTVGRGSLIEVEPGAAGRIFGLLSITAIPRRLALDFSDLFGKGFDFSAITGQFQFANGIARTDNLVMQGDSALVEVAGPINLVDKTYDQTVKITPKVSSALPLAGAVAGGPVGLGVGTAILIFDKLAGNIFDREIVNLISYHYQLTGPWDNPKINVVTPTTGQGQKVP